MQYATCNVTLNVLLTAHTRVIRAALPGMRARRRGHIVNISAAAAISNYAGFGIYGCAKAALELMSESLRLELAPLGIELVEELVRSNGTTTAVC